MITAEDARRLRECIAAGGVAVFPADTVYGLACDPLQDAAVRRLYELKGVLAGAPGGGEVLLAAGRARRAPGARRARARRAGGAAAGPADGAAAQPRGPLSAGGRSECSVCACRCCPRGWRRCARWAPGDAVERQPLRRPRGAAPLRRSRPRCWRAPTCCWTGRAAGPSPRRCSTCATTRPRALGYRARGAGRAGRAGAGADLARLTAGLGVRRGLRPQVSARSSPAASSWPASTGSGACFSRSEQCGGYDRDPVGPPVGGLSGRHDHASARSSPSSLRSQRRWRTSRSLGVCPSFTSIARSSRPRSTMRSISRSPLQVRRCAVRASAA